MGPAHVAPVVSFTAYGTRGAYVSLAFALWSGRRLALIPKFTVETVRDLLVDYQLSALRVWPIRPAGVSCWPEPIPPSRNTPASRPSS